MTQVDLLALVFASALPFLRHRPGLAFCAFCAGSISYAIAGILLNPGLNAALRFLPPIFVAVGAWLLMLFRNERIDSAKTSKRQVYASIGVLMFSAIVVADIASIRYGIVMGLLAATAFGIANLVRREPTAERLHIFIRGLGLMYLSGACVFGSLPIGIGGILMALVSLTSAASRVRSMRTALIMVLPLLLLACSPLKPSGGRSSDVTVLFSLREDGMNLLRNQNWRVRVRVYKVEQATSGDQEGSDAFFTADTADPTFQVGGVKLGLKEFTFDILNESGESMGRGEVRHLVRPGTQTLPPIRIRLVTPRRDLTDEYQVSIRVPGEDPKTTYLDVKHVFDDHCISCHGDESRPSPAGKLVLDEYPFYYTDSQHDPVAIVDDSVHWMRAADYPMPPPPFARVPAAKIAAVEKWKADGLLKFPAADASSDLMHKLLIHWQREGGVSDADRGMVEVSRSEDPVRPFTNVFSNAIAFDRYQLRVEVYGVDGSKTFELSQLLEVPERGDAVLALTFEGVPPDVRIPIVIEQ